jgi:hypothetical protein
VMSQVNEEMSVVQERKVTLGKKEEKLDES